MNISTNFEHAVGRSGPQKNSSTHDMHPTPAEGHGRDAAPSVQQKDISKQAAVNVLVNSLKGDFEAMGIVPPPRNFAGVSLSTNSGSAREESNGTLATMRLLMVKGIVSQLVSGQESAEARATEDHPVDLSL